MQLQRFLRAVCALSVCGLTPGSISGQDVAINFHAAAVGMIVGTNGIPVGTGFVVGSTNFIVLTCEHVISSQGSTSFHFVNMINAHVPVTVEKFLPRYDLAILKPEVETELVPLNYGDIRRLRPGDFIGYVGWNAPAKSILPGVAVITASGVAFNQGVSVDFIEFEGDGIPGYSGGPVFNSKGEVVALMREAWTKKGIKGGPEKLVNRAFAIEPAMLTREIFYPPSGPTTNVVAGTNTITIRAEPK